MFNDNCQVIGDASVIDLDSPELVTKQVAHLASKQFGVQLHLLLSIPCREIFCCILFAYLPNFDFAAHMFRSKPTVISALRVAACPQYGLRFSHVSLLFSSLI